MISDFLWNIEFIVSSFRVLVSIVSKSVIDHFITPYPYVRLGIAQVLIALILLLLLRSDFKTFLTLVRYSFSRFSFIVVWEMLSLSFNPKYLYVASFSSSCINSPVES